MAATSSLHVSQPSWNDLPDEIVQMLGLYLDAQGWASCRASCSSWRKHITGAVPLLEIDLERSAHRWMMVLTCVARIFPLLSSITLLVGNRIMPAVFSERLASLAITGIKLQELELRFLYLSSPMLGGWLEDLSGVTELRSLRVLRLAGAPCPPPNFFADLSFLRNLSTLEYLPGGYSQMAGNDMMNPGPTDTGDIGVTDAHLAAIGLLTQLKQLTVKVSAADTSLEGLHGLAAHGLLSNLEQLALYDLELPSECLSETLAGATALTTLQIGLCSVDDLSPISRLPKIQNLSLDTVALPDLRDLVLSAARGNIPPRGPGAITGLCLLDQPLAGAPHLASLSQLSSLQELVIVTPLVQLSPAASLAALAAAAAANGAAGDGNAAALDGAAAAAAAAAASGPQRQQLYKQECSMDVCVLTGLKSLKLLQIDLLSIDEGNMLPQILGVLHGAVDVDQQQQMAQDIMAAAAAAGAEAVGPPNHAAAAAAAAAQATPTLQGPLLLRFGSDSVGVICESWCELVTLDLSGFGPELLPEAAVRGLSNLRALKHLSLMSERNQPGQGVTSLWGQEQRRQLLQSGLRHYPWWTWPKGLSSLCLSHFDLGGNGSTEPRQQHCGSSMCHLLPKQQQQSSSTRAQFNFSRILHSSCATFSNKRRRQSQQQQQLLAGSSSQLTSVQASAACCPSSSSGVGSHAATGPHEAAGMEAAAAAAAPCSCLSRLAQHFSSLQALWLEHVQLPFNLLPAALPSAAGTLESLALLHVAGTTPADLVVVSSLTCLTSLRLLPEDHALEGLAHLTALRHLRKLNVRLTHLQPSDLAVLSQLRSLFCLSLSAPLTDGELLPGFPSAVRIDRVVALVHDSLPYCDVELLGDPSISQAM